MNANYGDGGGARRLAVLPVKAAIQGRAASPRKNQVISRKTLENHHTSVDKASWTGMAISTEGYGGIRRGAVLWRNVFSPMRLAE